MFKKKLKEQPLNYWEEQSYMMAIPKEADENLLKTVIERLTSSKEFEVKDLKFNVNGVANLRIVYEKEEYEVGFYLGGINVPDYYLNSFLFQEEEKQAILNAKTSLTIFMPFKENAKKSFHLQLKLATIALPDLIGVMDESAERMLPAKWVKMASLSKVLPSSKDLFNVQAITGKNGEVWLHTHGLCRCGITELEILESDQEHYKEHYDLLATYAMFLLDGQNHDNPEKKGAYIGRLINGIPIVATCVSWVEGLEKYKKLKLGNEKDRIASHNTKTSIVFLFTSEEEEKNGILNKVSIYNEFWGNNPIFFFSDEETERMSKLAKERFETVLEQFKNKENKIILKIGLPLKEKGKFEHIWFELLEVKDGKLKAKLTQEPYDVPNMHAGDTAWYTKEDITDWIIYTKEAAINPNNIYILEK